MLLKKMLVLHACQSFLLGMTQMIFPIFDSQVTQYFMEKEIDFKKSRKFKKILRTDPENQKCQAFSSTKVKMSHMCLMKVFS